MGKRERSFGFGKSLVWSVALLGLASFGPLACGSDEPTRSPGQSVGGEAAGGGPGQGIGVGDAGDGSMLPAGGGDNPVTPGDLVCGSDEDCRGSDKPVCDQVLGCVACQYDWDCPAAHRCQQNECFEKQACGTSSDCAGDAERPVCDGVQQICVGCRENTDCGASERCDTSECVAFEPCTNSRDCTGGKVCDRTVGACVACVVDGDCGEGSACVKNACVPTCESDKDCLGIGLLCDLQVKRCVECLGHGDCPSQYHCAASTCALDLCETGQTRCESEALLASCSEIGDAWVTASCGGSARCTEDGETASCVPLLCTPNATSCSDDGAAVVTCSADGLAIADTEPCLEGKACKNGACVEVICPPGQPVCNGQTLYQCNGNGTEQTFVENCGSTYGGTCNPNTNACEDWVCFPGYPTCDGNLATTCKPDGLGPEPNGNDCSLQNGVCLDGYCQEVICEDGYLCDGGMLKLCSEGGTQLQNVKNCNFQALCDAEGGKCITPTCTPGAFVCDGTVATRCKADGSGYAAGGQDCAETDLVCDGGGCLPEVCTPNAVYCQGGSPVRCGASGATYVPTDTCKTNEYCAEGSTTCPADKCTASAPVCNGNLLTTCASDGSGPLAGGTDCTADGKICEAGACVAVVCTPGSYSCQGEAVHVCKASGTGTTVYDTCSVGEFCDSSAETPVCAVDVCTAGGLGCDGEVISTCGANGGSWTSPGQNCKTGSQVCIVGGTCAAEEVSVQGLTSSVSAFTGVQVGVFRVLTSRTLTELETYASFQGLQKITWVVYEKRPGVETYDLVYQKVTSQTMAVAGIITSPALDFGLEKGKSYAVGVHITGTVNYGYSYDYYNSALNTFKGAFLTGAYAAQSSSGAQAQPETSLSPSYSYYYKTYLRMTTAVAP